MLLSACFPRAVCCVLWDPSDIQSNLIGSQPIRHVQQLFDVSRHMTVYWNLVIWPAILPPMFWETTGATFPKKKY